MPRFTPGLWPRAFRVGAILSPVGALATCDPSSDAGVASAIPGLLYVMAGGTVVAAIVLAIEAWARRRLQPRGAPSLPVFGFIAWALLPTFLAAFSLASGPVRRSELLLGAFALAWWLVAFLLVRGVLTAIVPALALIALPWCFLVANTVRRVGFIIREGGMERTDGVGSPALFLFNWTVELLVFIVPLTVIAVRLVRAFRKNRTRRREMALSALPRSAR